MENSICLNQNKKDEDEESRPEDLLEWKWEKYSEYNEHADSDAYFINLPEGQTQRRVIDLWGICIDKAKQGALIVDRFKFLKGKFIMKLGNQENYKPIYDYKSCI